MEKTKFRISIGKKMYVFIIITLLAATVGTAIISYYVSAQQIDTFYKTITINNAQNFASLVDPEYLQSLKELAASEEYQALRDAAEEADDEAMIEEYLKEHNMWEGYTAARGQLMTYLSNMEKVKYGAVFYNSFHNGIVKCGKPGRKSGLSVFHSDFLIGAVIHLPAVRRSAPQQISEYSANPCC